MNLKTIIYNNQQRDELVKFLSHSDIISAHKVEIKKIRPIRSINQNRYLWLCLAIAESDSGGHKDDLYLYYLDRFAPKFEKTIFGKPVEITKTSSSFDSKEMTEFIEKIRVDLHHEGIATPDPNDKKLAEIYQYYRNKGFL